MSENSQAKKREIIQYNTAKLTLDIATPLQRDTCIRTTRKQGCEYSGEEKKKTTLVLKEKTHTSYAVGFFQSAFSLP